MEMEEILEKIYKSSLKLLVPLSAEATYKSIVDEAIQLVDGLGGSIFLEKKGELFRAYTSLPELNKITLRRRGYTYQVFKKNEPMLGSINQFSKVHPILKKINSESDLLIPLSYENKSIGVLSILSKQNKKFTDQDLRIVRLFGPLATLAILKCQYFEDTKRALETRDLFISMASHELKTPITTIYAYMQLMQQKIEKEEPIKKSWVATLLQESKRLTDLINELLHVSKAQAGKLEYSMEKINLKTIAKQAIKDFSITHTDRKIIFEDEIGNKVPKINGDYNKLLQVIINLLNNAAKHSKPKKEIIVRLKNHSDTISVSIIDRGIGIPKKEIPNIFDQFYRGQHHRKEGMGLGLYLTKKIVEEHKGEINVESQLRKGTSVTVKIPLT